MAGGIFVPIFYRIAPVQGGEDMLVEKIYHWIRRKFCKHRFRKHYDVANRKYICRCVKCGETRQYDHC